MIESNGINLQKGASFYADNNKFNDIKKKTDKDAIQTVAKEFEAFFLQMTLKSMREANKAFESGFMSSNARDTYQEMADKQLSQHLAQTGSTGLADMIAKQLSSPKKVAHDPNKMLSMPLEFKEFPNKELMSPGTSKSLEVQNTRSIHQQTEPSVKPQSCDSSGISGAIKPGVRFQDPETFVREMMPHAERAAQALKLDPKVLIAQAALESAWGQKTMRDETGTQAHNLFGIKANAQWNGPKAVVATTEYEDGVLKHQKAPFRSYDNYAQSFDDYVTFLKSNPRYQEALSNSADPASYLNKLSHAGYATDPNYADKIMQVMKSPTLNAALKFLG